MKPSPLRKPVRSGLPRAARIFSAAFLLACAAATAPAQTGPAFVSPKPGESFGPAARQSEVLLKVEAPVQLKTVAHSGCCEVELEMKDASGGWKPVSKVEYPGLHLGVQRSVGEFKAAPDWRVRARAYKFKSEFAWGPWVEFRVQQSAGQ